MDHSVIFSSACQSGLEVMSSTEALEKYDWLSDYWWKAVKVDADKYTAAAELHQNHGYFLRASARCKGGISSSGLSLHDPGRSGTKST